MTWSSTSSESNTPVTSFAPGAIHSPFCSGPNPAQTSRDRRSWRVLRRLSGRENPTTVQVPSQSRFTAPVSQIRRRPSRSTATAYGVSSMYALRPTRYRVTRLRFTMRASVDRTASSETPRRANTSMTLPEEMAVPRSSA